MIWMIYKDHHHSSAMTYMSHYDGNAEALGEQKGQTFQPSEQRYCNRTVESAAESTTRTNTDLIEFNCLLLNEEGHTENQSLMSPAQASNNSNGRLSFQDQFTLTNLWTVQDKCMEDPHMYPMLVTLRDLESDSRFSLQEKEIGGTFVISALYPFLILPLSRPTGKHTDVWSRGHHTSVSIVEKHPLNPVTLKFTEILIPGKGFTSAANAVEVPLNERRGKSQVRPYQQQTIWLHFGCKFSHLWNLKLHHRIHTQDKLHQCFTRADILKVHHRTHTGERPYNCTVCDLTFKRRDHLKSHQCKHVISL